MKDDTKYTRLGKSGSTSRHTVNPPVHHASTVCFPTLEEMQKSHSEGPGTLAYGRFGVPVTFSLQDAVAELEGGHASLVCPSGLSALTATLLTFARPGGRILVADCVYAPTRHFCDTVLARLGIETTYFDPLHPDPSSLFADDTYAVFVESPGSLTLEFQDIPAWAQCCRERHIPLLMDNTWASPALFKPFSHGVNVSIQAATKYIVGHSDAMLGIITSDSKHFSRIRKSVQGLGLTAGPDDCYLGLRGLRTLGVRMKRHEENGLAVADWLKHRPEVLRVLHPSMEDHPGHAIWKRDFLGASGLFTFLVKPCSQEALGAMLDNMDVFSMGYSFGGYESLILPVDPVSGRTLPPLAGKGQYLRLSIGLEDPSDLINDLDKGFQRLAATG